MKHVCKIVYGLWDSIEDMAEALNESPNALKVAMESDQLPDSRHDEEIILTAVFNHSTLTRKHLENYRLKGVRCEF